MRPSSLFILATALVPFAFARFSGGPVSASLEYSLKIDSSFPGLKPDLAENLGSLYIDEGASCELFEDLHCDKYLLEVEAPGEDNLFNSGVGYVSNSIRCNYASEAWVYRQYY
ncbi:hypothetical protein BDV25DRAFT_136732 [Aspergillus avenaceus]|uniref:AA1-like domain-containing protein n=1 Tax=Aspergillus avenaceus TaxID=36643 RepID=A0A5N6U4P0_ASPAV|nr:hypothetical protein BDV25DRAFT_136732 [Aspergillus avenaceus]